jgi:hypothetical protein
MRGPSVRAIGSDFADEGNGRPPESIVTMFFSVLIGEEAVLLACWPHRWPSEAVVP